MVFKNEKYIVRRFEEKDIDKVASLVKENKYLSTLWEDCVSEEEMDRMIRSMYIDNETSFGIFGNEDETFYGYMGIDQYSECEGELSVRLKNNAPFNEIVALFGDVLAIVGVPDGRNLTMSYSFD